MTADYRAEVALATLRRDRWGWLALNPGAQEGSICSMPIDVPDQPFDILLNADGCRGMRVELLDERLQPIEGFSGADAGRVDADGGLDCLVQWATEIPSTMHGRLVRVLVTMQKSGDAQSPQLYAIALKARQ